ncbi:MAG: hypothetical protein GC157_14585 [Frankiales bacterium]|nr:hypothetical protein [Frankiales bacterium]
MRTPARLLALAAALALVASGAAAGIPGEQTAPAEAATSGGQSTTKTVTATRTHLDAAGNDVATTAYSISVTVGDTHGLRDRQAVPVSWTGAPQSGGIVADQNSAAAVVIEHPVVVLECRGVDSSTVPAAQQLSPETCWTQSWAERFKADYSTAYPEWRMDRYATAEERTQFAGAPSPRPAACTDIGISERWVPFVSESGTRYYGGSSACAGMPPEATSNLTATNLPSNETFAVTGADGTGSILFNVRSADSNASLGCSDTVACSVVIVPVVGISCDEAGAGLPVADRPLALDLPDIDAACTSNGNFAPGSQFVQGDLSSSAVNGSLWWSASNWRNRVSVPLHFAPSASVCSVVGGKAPIAIYGSELMTQATLQWAPPFCLDSKKTPFQHVQTGEPQAANLLKVGNIEAAFASNLPSGGYSRPVVNAPVALTGYAVTFSIDDAQGRLLTSLRLNARLLAKLLTESYPSYLGVKNGNPAAGIPPDEGLKNNPLNLTFDPEFQALNPDVPTDLNIAAASTILTVSSSTDVMTAVTSYIDADPEAHAFMAGEPDPWGMTVNPAYKGMALPVSTWPLLDDYVYPFTRGQNACFYYAPVPYLPQVAAPMLRFAYVTLNMQFSIANSQLKCTNPNANDSTNLSAVKLVAQGRQTPGLRFVLGITSLADAERYRLATASLQTSGVTPSSTRFTDATGRSFAAPTDAALKAAAGFLAPDDTTHTWVLQRTRMSSDPAGAGAYPGAMLVSMSVPTTGLPATDAAAYAAFMTFAATTGQTPGTDPGQLPAGYLPLSPANGLSALSAYTARAAVAVAAQNGTVPSVTGHDPTPTPTPTPRPTPTRTTASSGQSGGTGSGVTYPTTTPDTGSSASASAAPSPTPTPSPSTSSPSVTPVSLGTTPESPIGPVGVLLPVLLGLGLACVLLGPALAWRPRGRL